MNLKIRLLNLRLKFVKSPVKRAHLIKKMSSITIGDKCEIYNNVSFGSEPYLIEIGNNVRVTSGVKFITHDGGVWVLRNNGMAKNADIFRRIKLGDNIHIGMNAVIMPGVTIGSNVIVAVGAIVTKDIPSNTIVGGVPAKKIKTINEYFEKNKKNIDYTKHLNYTTKKAYLKKKYLSNDEHY